MVIPRILTLLALQALRRQGGVASSAGLQEALGVSQPTVSRALAPLIQSGQVRKVGAAVDAGAKVFAEAALRGVDFLIVRGARRRGRGRHGRELLCCGVDWCGLGGGLQAIHTAANRAH